jgi:hypothetical protein
LLIVLQSGELAECKRPSESLRGPIRLKIGRKNFYIKLNQSQLMAANLNDFINNKIPE